MAQLITSPDEPINAAFRWHKSSTKTNGITKVHKAHAELSIPVFYEWFATVRFSIYYMTICCTANRPLKYLIVTRKMFCRQYVAQVTTIAASYLAPKWHYNLSLALRL